MTSKQAVELKRTGTAAGVGAVLAAIGMFAAFPTLLAAGLLVCWGSAFLTLIGFLETVS